MSEPKPTYDAGFAINNVALIGYGYWGTKMARVLDKLGALRCIIDTSDKQAGEAQHAWGHKTDISDNYQIFSNVDSVVIATPPHTHYALVAEALARGLHVFVEKPMTTNYNQAVQLEKMAREKKLHLAVGHIYLHCPGLNAIPLPVGSAELFVKLLNQAGAPSETTRDLLWAGMPHCASIAGYFFPDEPEDMHIVQSKDRLQVWMNYFDGSHAVFDVADWTGMRRRDVELRIGDERWLFNSDIPDTAIRMPGRTHFSTLIPGLTEPAEPLELELRSFLRCEPDGVPGSRVVKILEMIKAKIDGC